ncbi:MAG: aspartate kinase [Anaerovoracaceae bacterium]
MRRINEEDLAQDIVDRAGKAEVKVAKFGGTSLADADAFRRVADILKSDASRKYTVVSAPGYISEYDIKVTDLLVRAVDAFDAGDKEKADGYIDRAAARFDAIAQDLGIDIDETAQWEGFRRNFFSGAGRAYLVSRGEYSCARLLARFAGCDFVDAAEIIKFSTNGKFDRESTSAAVKKVLSGKERAVIPGFYGSDASGEVVTFPRGGSDITGAIIAAASDADLYENWTDVRGLLLADPKVIKSPLTVPVITYRELRELAVKGAEVVHEDAVIPVERVGIPMNVRCTSEPDHSGTLIVKNADYYESMLDISGITGKSDCAEITIEQEKLDEIPGFRKNLRNYLVDRGIKVITELSGVDSINLVVSRDEIDDPDALTADIKEATGAANVMIDTDMAVISVVGRKLDESPAISVKALEALAGSGIEMKLIDEAAGRISMTIGVRKDSYIAGVKAIYETFTRKGPED